jgi:hypothetical protein
MRRSFSISSPYQIEKPISTISATIDKVRKSQKPEIRDFSTKNLTHVLMQSKSKDTSRDRRKFIGGFSALLNTMTISKLSIVEAKQIN